MVQNREVNDVILNITDTIIDVIDTMIPKNLNTLRKLRNPNQILLIIKPRRNKGNNGEFLDESLRILFKWAKVFTTTVKLKIIFFIVSSMTNQQLWRKVKSANNLYHEITIFILETWKFMLLSDLKIVATVAKWS